MEGLVAELLLEPRQLVKGLLQLPVLEGDGGLVGDGLEQAQVVRLEARALAQAVDDRQCAEDAVLADEGPDHRLATCPQSLVHDRPGRALKARPSLVVRIRSVSSRGDRDRDHGLGPVAAARRAAQGGVERRVGEEQQLRALGPEHPAGVLEQGADRRVELRGVVEQPARLVEELEPFVLLAFAHVGAVGHEHDRRSGRPAGRSTAGRPRGP